MIRPVRDLRRVLAEGHCSTLTTPSAVAIALLRGLADAEGHGSHFIVQTDGDDCFANAKMALQGLTSETRITEYLLGRFSPVDCHDTTLVELFKKFAMHSYPFRNIIWECTS